VLPFGEAPEIGASQRPRARHLPCRRRRLDRERQRLLDQRSVGETVEVGGQQATRALRIVLVPQAAERVLHHLRLLARRGGKPPLTNGIHTAAIWRARRRRRWSLRGHGLLLDDPGNARGSRRWRR